MAIFKVSDRGSPLFRITLLLMALVVSIGGMSYLRYYAAGSNRVVPRDLQEYVKSDEAADVLHPFSAVPPEPDIYPTVYDDVRRIEHSRRPGSIGTLDHAILKLCAWMGGKGENWLAQNALWRGAWHYENIVSEPSRWRFLPMHVYGTLVAQEEIEYPDNPPGLRKLFMLTLYDLHERNFFTVLTPLMPADAELTVESAPGRKGKFGSTLACDAVYVMAFPYLTRVGLRETPLFLAPRVWHAAEGPTPRPYLDGRGGIPDPLDDLPNRPLKSISGIDQRYVRSKMYYPPKQGDRNPDYLSMASDVRSEKSILTHVYEYLYGLEPEVVREAGNNPEINYVTLMQGQNAPEWMIGQFTSFTGVVLSVETLRFPDPDDGINRIYLITAGDLRFANLEEFTWVAAALDLPEGLRRGDRISAAGIFLKLYPYRTRASRWHWAPLLVCRDVRLEPTPVSPLFPAWLPQEALPWIFVGVSLLMLLLFLHMFRTSQNDTRRLEEVRKRSQQKWLNARPGKRAAKGKLPAAAAADGDEGAAADGETSDGSASEAADEAAPPPDGQDRGEV